MNRDDWDRPLDGGDTTSGAPAPAGDPWTSEELQQAQQWANDYYTSHQIPSSWGSPDDLANNYAQQRRNGVGHQAAMDAVPGLLGWDKYTAPSGGQPPPGPPGPPGPGGGGGSSSIGAMDPAAVFQAPTIANGMPSWMPSAPGAPAQPNFPQFEPAPKFDEPDYEQAMKDPGYLAELGQGRQQMEQSAAARGVLNGGGTLKDINQWGSNMAAQRVNDVRDRATNRYLLNYQTQHVDPYKYAYQRALDQFTGGMNIWQGQNSQWQTQAQVAQRNAEDTWQQAYTPFNDLWNRRIQVGMA